MKLEEQIADVERQRDALNLKILVLRHLNGDDTVTNEKVRAVLPSLSDRSTFMKQWMEAVGEFSPEQQAALTWQLANREWASGNRKQCIYGD